MPGAAWTSSEVPRARATRVPPLASSLAAAMSAGGLGRQRGIDSVCDGAPALLAHEQIAATIARRRMRRSIGASCRSVGECVQIGLIASAALFAAGSYWSFAMLRHPWELRLAPPWSSDAAERFTLGTSESGGTR